MGWDAMRCDAMRWEMHLLFVILMPVQYHLTIVPSYLVEAFADAVHGRERSEDEGERRGEAEDLRTKEHSITQPLTE